MNDANDNTPTITYIGSKKGIRTQAYRDLCKETRAALTKVMGSVCELHVELQKLLTGMGSVEALLHLEDIHDEIGRIKIGLLPRS